MPRAYKDQSPAALQRLPEYIRKDEWIRAFLREAKVGHIATALDDQPFLNPSTFWFDEANHQIVFHSNLTGRNRSNIESNSRVCFEACELGKMLPSNVALEFSLQFRSVILFGTTRILTDPDETRRVMYRLIQKYFPAMSAGHEYREITDKELKRTSVYAIKIEEWSGKENWKDRADQSDEWAPLNGEWFE
jgi:nitroimidazol reductase NimA-like FMN-containing flavoprotein (pyridoxamine 5'-phosphate oxidase superfamily)